VRLTILTPAFNEEAVVEASCLEILRALPDDAELLVVDDGSIDGTPAILQAIRQKDSRLRVVTHPENRGLGSALTTGFAQARGDVIVTMDADLSHPMSTVEVMLERCVDADAVYASRYVEGGGMEGVPQWRQSISRVANHVLRFVLRLPMHDVTTGFRAFRAEVVRDLPLRSSGFEVQLEISARLVADGRKVVEVPLLLRQRAAGMSKMRYLGLLPRYFRTLVRVWRVRHSS
jgi:dolichol-phosphate mannosyltransferase